MLTTYADYHYFKDHHNDVLGLFWDIKTSKEYSFMKSLLNTDNGHKME